MFEIWIPARDLADSAQSQQIREKVDENTCRNINRTPCERARGDPAQGPARRFCCCIFGNCGLQHASDTHAAQNAGVDTDNPDSQLAGNDAETAADTVAKSDANVAADTAQAADSVQTADTGQTADAPSVDSVQTIDTVAISDTVAVDVADDAQTADAADAAQNADVADAGGKCAVFEPGSPEYAKCCADVNWDYNEGCMAWGPPVPPTFA